MSGIVLSASVRQNLLSFQSTAELLATTQNRLSTGKKVNTALDNPTNFFTAASLDNRASDISNLLDGIGNGVQVLQAANTGITSLQKLVDSAKSVANQVLQATVGYSTKSTITAAAVAGANASDLAWYAYGLHQQHRDRNCDRRCCGDDHPTERTDVTRLRPATASPSMARPSRSRAPAATSISASGATLDLTTATVGDLLVPSTPSPAQPRRLRLAARQLTLSTGTAQDLVIGGTAGR